MSTLRIVQKATREGGWLTVEMEELVEGDTFRMFEPDSGDLVIDSEGRAQWVVEGTGRMREDGVWEVPVRIDG